MKNTPHRKQAATLLLVLLSIPAWAGKPSYLPSKGTSQPSSKTVAGCLRASAATDLDLNNIRAMIYTGGDMWWDHSGAARYEVPKGSGKNSLFAGSLWIGGVDNGNLYMSAVQFRQSGDDFWPGPLNTVTAQIDPETCSKYDRHFKINRTDVEAFVKHKDYPNVPRQDIPRSILEWPAHGDAGKGEDYYLAPFTDVGNDNYYEPEKGDYPGYDLNGTRPCQFNTCEVGLYGDQTLWWVFNDNGNVHSESKGRPIGMEIRAQAFAFSTNDEINNMTFYNYTLINRSSYTLNEAYFGQWIDPDLGYAIDDYVGCDVGRGLGYCYNGVQCDPVYGCSPPAIGVDFFEGPYMDPDGMDDPKGIGPGINGLNFGDGVADNERWGMRRFVYHNNDNGVTGDPQTASDYYNYLRGIWRDGTPMEYGGNGHLTGGIRCEFMFPGDTDPEGWGTQEQKQAPWTEQTANNFPGDRRFLQSAGPFTLKPGACNNITVGVVWAQAISGDPFQSVELVRQADDKAQALFENCFRIMNGPDAPDMAVRELDREIVLTLHPRPHPTLPGKTMEDLEEESFFITCPGCDKNYRFQGYQIFQLKDQTVTYADIHNPDRARLVAQCDIKDGVGQIVNYYKHPQLSANYAVEEVNGADKGIQHAFRVTEDLFAAGDKRLVNHKPYYYTVISYAYNNYKTYNPFDPNSLDGQKQPYYPGRRNVKTYSAIPHHPAPENNGQTLNSGYGTGVSLTRMAGQGNGGNVLELAAGTMQEILSSPDHRARNIVYMAGNGPVGIKVVDPVKVPKADFKIMLDDTAGSSGWTLINITTGDSVRSDKNIQVVNEQVIARWGLSVSINYVRNPGDEPLKGNGYLESGITFSNPYRRWLTGVPDMDGSSAFNWIRSGKVTNDPVYSDYVGYDDDQVYEKVLGGIAAPYRLGAQSEAGPAWKNSALMSSTPNPQSNRLQNIPSVDLVITSDPSKWTRCVVVELGENALLNEGGAKKMDKRIHPSVDKSGKEESPLAQGIGAGKGWFPGYAVNVETGERLNILFGEDSWLTGENGSDMQWNPTARYTDDLGTITFGGKHYIYIMNSRYDECARYDTLFSFINDVEKRKIYKEAGWVMLPMVAPSEKLRACDVTIRFRVSKPYQNYDPFTASNTSGKPEYTFSTKELAAEAGNKALAKSALDLINVVPNPYYAYSSYEKDRLDNRIKIVNLPSKCTVSIYTVNGTLIRKFNRDVSADQSQGSPVEDLNMETSQEWDLKNNKGIPIASGLYIIHVDAQGIGEKTVKWFGVMRPVDMPTY